VMIAMLPYTAGKDTLIGFIPPISALVLKIFLKPCTENVI